MNNKVYLNAGIALLTTLGLVACNGGNSTSSTATTQTSPLQQYISSLTYTPANGKSLTAGGTQQQSFTTPGGLTINSVDIKFYSGANCSGSLVSTKTLNGSAENPVIPAAGTYTSTNASNNALCGSYANGTTTSAGCSGLYADMGSGNMRSMQYSYNVQNSQGIISQIVGACMYNPAVTVGSTTGVEGVANWSIPQACTGGTCGFSQAYSVDLTPPTVVQIALPQTGQTPTSPLTATAGMDGFTYLGVPWAYVRSGTTTPATRFSVGSGAEAGCITDNLTGLMWVKNLNSVAINDSTAGSKTSWQNALDSIATANSGSGYCGHTDWWLPNVNEMASLINQGAANSATWLNSKGFSNVQANLYWSSTSYAFYPTNVWNVDMGSSTVNIVNNVNSYYVWPVRRNSVITNPPAQIPQTGQTTTYSTGDDGSLQKGTVGTNSTGRFVVATDPSGNVCTSGQEVESDLQTGLMWVKALSSTKYTWANAIAKLPTAGAAIPASYCGYSDWRLPNRNELRSLANYGESNVTTWLNAQGFSNVQASNYWSSSTYASDISYAWNVTMNAGIVIRGVKTGTNYVWPVRGGG